MEEEDVFLEELNSSSRVVLMVYKKDSEGEIEKIISDPKRIEAFIKAKTWKTIKNDYIKSNGEVRYED